MTHQRDPQACPHCGGQGMCYDVRRHATGMRWRRRRCKDCGRRWSTTETLFTPAQILALERRITTSSGAVVD